MSEHKELRDKLAVIVHRINVGGYLDYGGETQAITELMQLIEAELTEARLDERKRVALDNYHGQTFSDSTNYKGKFDKFIENNERRLAELNKGKES